MINKLKLTPFLFFLFAILSFSGCQVEENAVSNDAKLSSYKLRTISKSEIDSNAKIVEKLQKLAPQNSNTAKNVPINDLGLIIQTNHANYIENGNYHSYTFSTLQKDTDKIKNVLFSLNENGQYDAYLVEYDYNKIELKNFGPNNKPGAATIKPINLDFSSVTSKSVAIWVCESYYELVGSGDLVGAENVTYSWVLVTTNCRVINATIIEEDSSTTNYTSGTASYTSNGYMNPAAGGGGSIATSPLFSMYDEPEIIKIETVKKYIATSGPQSRFLEQNGEIAFAFYDFLVQNKFSEESKSFGKQILEQFIQNPSMKFDIQASLKSPMNIDRSSINDELPEGKKFNAIYKALTESPEFKKLFLHIFQNSTRFNVKFQTGNIAGGANGDTKTNLLAPTNNIITIDANFIKNNSKLVVAKTILHECIHAFLNVKLCDGQLGNIPNINNEDFYNIVNKSYDGFNNNQAQHNFIYNYMIPTMEKVLAEIRDKLLTPEEITTMNSLKMHIPFNNSPETDFIWTDFYHNLSLSGLQNCTFFKKEIGTFGSGNIPLITINQTLMQSFNQYNNYARIHLHP